MALVLQVFAEQQKLRILDPTVEVTVQELVDETKELEQHLWNHTYPQMIAPTGKDPLGGGQYTAITNALVYGWQYEFEEKAGPTVEHCLVKWGNLVAFTDFKQTVQEPFNQTDYTWVQYAQSTAPAALGLETVQATLETIISDIADLGTEVNVREGNVRRIFTPAVAPNATRLVAIDQLDYITLEIKADADADWSSPISTKTLYCWYSSYTSTKPIKVGESD
jgi:hypothetical protein